MAAGSQESPGKIQAISPATPYQERSRGRRGEGEEEGEGEGEGREREREEECNGRECDKGKCVSRLTIPTDAM